MSYYDQRIEKIREWMGENGVDLSIITSPANVMYVSGYYGDPHERFMGVAVPRKGKPFLLLPELDREKAESKTTLPVYTHQDTESAWEILVQHLELDLAEVHLAAIEKTHMSVARLEDFQQLFSKAVYLNVEERLTKLRLQKDAKELSIMRRAAKLADEAVAFAVSQFSLGRQEFEIVQAIELFSKRTGAERMSFETMVLVGEKSALPHGVPGSREIRRGDLVLIDMGVVVDGYCSDITRTFAVGEVNDKQRSIYESVLAANLAAIATVRPGVAAGEIDGAARRVIELAGYGDYFIHRVGHGLGIDIHEVPSLHGKNEMELISGMTFTIEPGIYLPDVGGVRIEDDVVVTDTGIEILTAYPKELQIVPC